jgi:hypothetical protein
MKSANISASADALRFITALENSALTHSLFLPFLLHSIKTSVVFSAKSELLASQEMLTKKKRI